MDVWGSGDLSGWETSSGPLNIGAYISHKKTLKERWKTRRGGYLKVVCSEHYKIVSIVCLFRCQGSRLRDRRWPMKERDGHTGWGPPWCCALGQRLGNRLAAYRLLWEWESRKMWAGCYWNMNSVGLLIASGEILFSLRLSRQHSTPGA